ncbi:S4 domain-containing protein YaaA [Lacticaseibacillus pabuli]|uniref:S4 domain-containing protein YaaA n=1 Tax=Lacticaseibacillus pabuli TaxID=3025672 RepID=A0ABY7WR45_9LACO|nr:S4 domain-containing protein YaaA [Lacticaseibacillus sp. KACC 23028]WDF82664.1 S4 domain-containing protein YaaA [Lacticaseibacillus sp. KACC 23028]
MQEITIHTPQITLGQALKETGIIDTGGAAKWFLRENTVQVNGEDDNRRGRKLDSGDVVTLPDGTQFTIVVAI